MKTHLLPFAFVGGLIVSQVQAASYTNDFSGTGANTDFPTETNGSWALASGMYRSNYSNSETASSAAVSVAGVAGTNFSITTQFTVASASTAPVDTGVNTIGFGILGGNATFSGDSAPNAYYLADFSYANGTTAPAADTGRLRILSLGDATGFTATNSLNNFDGATTGFAIQKGVTYTLKLTGTYVGSTLNLALSLFDATGTIQIGTSATASDTSPLAGSNFGYRERTGTNTVLDVSYDNFSIVPEPSSALLAGVAGLGLIGIRRRGRNA